MSAYRYAGSTVFQYETRARQDYPGLTKRHPQLYPGVLVPVWAVKVREGLVAAGLLATARPVFAVLKRIFPKESAKDYEERMARASDVVDAMLAVIALGAPELYGSVGGERYAEARRALLTRMWTVVEAAGFEVPEEERAFAAMPPSTLPKKHRRSR